MTDQSALPILPLDEERPGRLFLFIDETGDPGRPDTADSSAFYQLNVVTTSRSDLPKIVEHVSRFRYFLDAGKELERYRRQRGKLCELLQVASGLPQTRLHAFYLLKASYLGPYLRGTGRGKYDWNPTKFRNFVIRKSLERVFADLLPRHWNDLYAKGLEIELVFDRFLPTEMEEQNLKQYLRGNYRLPPFLHIVQVDSEYSDMVQLADLLGRLVKQEVIDSTSHCGLRFVSVYDLTDPSRLEKRKGPGAS